MGDMGMEITGLKRGIKFPGCSQECVGDCVKSGRGNVAMECPDIRTRNGTYDTIILEKGESSRGFRSYADVTREDMKTSSGQNRLIIS